MRSRPTSRDIAAAAGVSQATVSRALRNSPLVRPETRQRILDIAKALNYRVDRSAAGLRTRESRTLALLLFEDANIDASQINPFFLNLVSSITLAAAAIDYDILLSFQQLSRDWVARYEASNRADGLILLGYGDFLGYAQRVVELARADAHFVTWGPATDIHGGTSVGCDNVAGGRLATQHLVDNGRRRIAFVGDASAHYPEFQARWTGYLQAQAAAGLVVDPSQQVAGHSSVQDGYRATRELLAADVNCDGIVAASDLIAFGVLNALHDAGKAIPADVGVVGFDDIPAATYVRPALTTIRQDTDLAGRTLVQQLLRLINDQPTESVVLEPTLVVRDSSVAVT